MTPGKVAEGSWTNPSGKRGMRVGTGYVEIARGIDEIVEVEGEGAEERDVGSRDVHSGQPASSVRLLFAGWPSRLGSCDQSRDLKEASDWMNSESLGTDLEQVGMRENLERSVVGKTV